MSEDYNITNPGGAQQFLRRFPEQAKRRGEALFRSGALGHLQVDVVGTSYSVVLNENPGVTVSLTYDPFAGWTSDCQQHGKEHCYHAFAAMSGLLAEFRSVAVDTLSATLPGLQSALQAARIRPEETEGGNLAHRLAHALGRKLTGQERRYVDRVTTAYKNTRNAEGVPAFHFDDMGLRIPQAWGILRVWPQPPQDEYEFWLYIAYEAQRRGVRLPDFMQAITDFSTIEQRVREFHRQLEVEEWTRRLDDQISRELQKGRIASPQQVDLRIRIDQEGLVLEQRTGESNRFEQLKVRQASILSDQVQDGSVQFSTQAHLVWPLFSELFQRGLRTLSWFECSDRLGMLLSGLLRNPLLADHIVDCKGQPLKRHSEPLRWQMTSPTQPDGDYIVRLVKSDDHPAPEVLCWLPGTPNLIVTNEGLFTGPDLMESILHPGEETRIPARALEQPSGIRLLQHIGVEVPESIKRRTRTVTFNIQVKCRLETSTWFGKTELCIITLAATSEDGREMEWSHAKWVAGQAKPGAIPNNNDSIIVYDYEPLERIERLMADLNPLTFGRRESAIKVQKSFPEVFSRWLQELPPNCSVLLEGELASFASAEVSGSVKLEVTETEIDWFDLRVVLDVSDTQLTSEEIKLLLSARGKFVRLQGKGWKRLHYNLSAAEDENLARIGLSPRELTSEPQRLHALQLADKAAKKFLPEEQFKQLQRRAAEIQARVHPDLPAAVKAELRPYQLEGFHFLAYLATNRFGGILADDMGLGKTLQTLAWLCWIREEASRQHPNQPVAHSLVVCPKSVMDNWHAEAQRFVPTLRVKVWDALEIGRFRLDLEDVDLHVMNYNQLRNLSHQVAATRWLVVILDEGQYIKNPRSQTAAAARSLRATHRLILTGTPIENRLLDLWSLVGFAMPGVLGSRAEFARVYDSKTDPLARQRLASRVRPFLLRRTKAQVAKDLPARIEEDLFCEMEGEQQALYRAELKRAQQLLLGMASPKDVAKHQMNFLTSLLRLRQICCHPRLLVENSQSGSAKVDALLEQVEPLMEEGHKVLVFSQFVELLGILRNELEHKEWRVFYLAGETENRGELVADFQGHQGPAIFLISLKAGGFGLNLTAASYVVLFDPWWNPAVENQAIDRTHRIGQQQNVIAYRLLIKNSIEEKIRTLQRQKKALAEDVLGEERFAQQLSMEDLRFLFSE